LIAELELDAATPRLKPPLQWGRDQLIAELRHPHDGALALVCFNGAAIN